MICFDSNIIIYIANGVLTEQSATSEPIVYPSIARVETLGYTDIKSAEEREIRILLSRLIEAPLTNEVIERAVILRQQKRMSLGDAIVAATALENGCTLWTANEDDFKHVDGLKIHNPVKYENESTD